METSRRARDVFKTGTLVGLNEEEIEKISPEELKAKNESTNDIH